MSQTEQSLMTEPFTARMVVRHYELDALGHVNDAVYVQWANHVRWLCVRAAGVTLDARGGGIRPVNLETTIRYHRELREGDAVDVSCAFAWGDGKTFRIDQEFRRPDGTLVAELGSVCGLMDLRARRLVPDPAGYQRTVTTTPDRLGLPPRPQDAPASGTSREGSPPDQTLRRSSP
jgi:acyl-CoA thioester hydrolase